MRVAMVTTSYPLWPGQAAGHFVAAEAAELCARGDEVVVFAPGPRDTRHGDAPEVVRVASGSAFGPPGVLARLRQKPWRGFGALAFVLRTRRLLARRAPFDRIVCHWLLPCAWPLAAGGSAPLEVVVHGSDVELLRRLPCALRKRALESLLRRPLEVRCVSEALREQLLELSPAALEPFVRVAPCSITVSGSPSRAEARKQLGLSAAARVVVIAGRLVASKRVNVALEAVSCLPDVELVVVGGGPELSRLQCAFPAARFTGELSRPEALAWIAAADVLLSASRREGAPSVVREARALGVPVVACAAGDLERWATEDAGLWVVS